jgi:hypothetical protein
VHTALLTIAGARVKPTPSLLCAALLACAAAHAAPPAMSPLAPAASAPASAAVRATRGASAACGYTTASSPRLRHAVTSKVRHIPIEGDPCASSAGVAPPLAH